VTVIAASRGYPGKFTAGLPIAGLDEAGREEGVTIFHSGTSLADGKLVTSGGRVLAVTAVADTLQDACDHAYAALEQIHFEGIYYRRDIAHSALHSKEK
jgi:phosphoribosylamine---glycine ligase